MNKIAGFFKKLFKIGGDGQSTESVQELRAAFATRYHNFKLLLTANNKALEIMSDMEKALDGNQSFGMSFVRSHCTAVSVNVFKIVKHLSELAPRKYDQLFNSFRTIQEGINQELASRKIVRGDHLVLPLHAVDRSMVDEVGSKMASVAEIGNEANVPVPPGFVVTALAYERFFAHNDLQAEIDRRIQAAKSTDIHELYSLSAGIQQLVIQSPVPEDLEEAIKEAYRAVEQQVGAGVTVSLRSSALGEDAAGTSFAGQFRSELNISSDHLLDAYKEVVASKYGLPAVTYRLARGIPDEDVAMCVGCMVMVQAASGGVMYSCNPLNIRDRSLVINSVWGLPKAVVDGSVDPDVFVVERTPQLTLTRKEIKVKEREFTCYPDEGVCRLDVTGDKKDNPSLTDEQALELARLGIALEEYYGSPQDIEWAVTPEGQVYILQCRPLTQLELAKTDRGAELEGVSPEQVATRGGVTASPGVACGPAFIVKSGVDRLKFPPGSILVTEQSLPRWAPLLSRAAAVVTELGGVAGHLANVAREFGVPALFGVSGATHLIKTGELLTVDADGLTVYKGEVQSLLAEAKGKKNLMEGSPVFDALRRVGEHIIPLTLLDPEAPSFHPAKCKTLHDITRFCHEKSVHEMFNFGKEHHFSERSSKQLVCETPMQWWIINLDDGFKEDVEGKFVRLENIVSIPMLAIWEGAIAVPWAGPPPVDSGGLMNIMYQATANPALDPSMASPYAARNYFMLSKNFCSLTSRFGFHFSTVEALVSERPSENYISFSFKGGAADFDRRVRRAYFVGNLLEECGFRAEIKKDGVFARVEGQPEEYMKERLKILGYLIIHTRQLDMVMANQASVNHYREKLLDDIRQMLEDPDGSDAAGAIGQEHTEANPQGS
jgi:pyruvate,water dikinase